ncbi:hypothetical protein B9Z55_000198 [Caenorhabditis nigoni]|uniref:DUF38 domain-containing protein n=1 Tax=Caenorhabditis nigoni TaxID=1611254 RepID=A0A2G5VI93_9PELO|nr:hypothetical protein B9Z55_000198 [Caenorhabditis nigoni]
MEPKPMLFCDTKTVLTYMEASCRFNLALKIPSIRKAEKAAPLIINRLELFDNHFVVNETEYKMKVYRQCHGELDNDVGENGARINVDESIQPGDITLGDLRRAYLKRWPVPKRPIKSLQHGCPPQKMYIRLYVSGSKYQFPHTNMKMYQLMKRLLTIFFGNRSGEWTVKNMSLQNNVLRWPVDGRRPIVRNVNIGNYSQLKMNIDSIIDSSVPLNNLQMRVPKYSHDRILDHPLLLHADHVTISNYPPESFLSDLFSIQAHTVIIEDLTSTNSVDFESLIFVFMEKTRPIGVRYKIFTRYKTNLELIRHPEVFERSINCIKLAMGSDAMVVFQFSRIHFDTWLNIEACPRNV